MPSHAPFSPTGGPPVLVLGGGITALGVLRILARNGIPRWLIAPPGDLAFASRHARPAPAAAGSAPSPAPADDFASWLQAFPVERAMLVPASDAWVRTLARLDPALRSRFPVAVAAPEVLQQAVDKALFASLLGRIGVPHPRSWTLDGPADLQSVPDSSYARGFLKPRDSQAFFARFGVKGLWVGSRTEAARRLDELRRVGLAVQLQEYIPGPPTAHVFVDGYAVGGKIHAQLVRRRLRMYPTDFGNSTYMVTIPPEDAGDAVRSVERLIGELSFRGVFSVELKQSEVDGRFYAIEMNARPWWFVDYAARAGVDVILLSWLDALGQPLPAMRGYQIGRRCVHPYYDWFAISELRQRHRATRWDWLRAIPGADQPVFRWSDLGPTLKTARATLGARRRPRSSPR